MTTSAPVATPDITRQLAKFAVEARWEDLPEPARAAARRTFGNAVALMVGSSRHPAVAAILGALDGLGMPAQASVLGRAERLGVVWAPLVNGVAAHVEDFDDTHLPTVVHPGAAVVPAALALGEWRGASGEDVLCAVAVGVEVALRVGLGLTPAHFDQGWHLTGTAGHVGAAAAAGRMLGLGVNELQTALALGATQAAGLTAALGTMVKSFHPGKAAADGVEAALLAQRGFTSAPTMIEGRRGLAAVASPAAEPDLMVDELGSRWELEANAFKPYACGIVSHAIIDAAIELREQATAEEIESVELTVHPVVLDVMGVLNPAAGLEAKFSAPHCFAVGLLDGTAGLEQYTDARVGAADAQALRARVRIKLDPAVAKGAAVAQVTTADGRRLHAEVPHATGSAERPMTDAQLRAKASALVEPILGEGSVDLIDLAFAADALDDLDALTAAARPTGTSG
jgi:2-methylcitrate dehydratase PrpD